MRLRTIKPGFFENDVLASLPPLTRLLFAGLWCYADREGRFEWRPRRIKAAILPYDDCDVLAMLRTLVVAGHIQGYCSHDHVSGAPESGCPEYGVVVCFSKHQRPHVNEQPSQIPAPPPLGHGTTMVVPSNDQGDCMDAQSLGSGIHTPPPKPDGSGGGVVETQEETKQPGKPPLPAAVDLCEWMGDCIAHWKPDARITCESKSSISEMGRLITVDGRDPAMVRSLLGWLFGCGPQDYAPESTFDWRPNIQSGGALRKQWDRLETLYTRRTTTDSGSLSVRHRLRA